MGTSEFYRVVEGFAEIADSLVVDTGRLGAEGRLILYVVPAAGRELDLNVRCICCCMLITEPGNWLYSLRVPLIVGTSAHTHRIPNHIY